MIRPTLTAPGARLVETLLDTFLDAANENTNHRDAKIARRALADVRRAQAVTGRSSSRYNHR